MRIRESFLEGRMQVHVNEDDGREMKRRDGMDGVVFPSWVQEEESDEFESLFKQH